MSDVDKLQVQEEAAAQRAEAKAQARRDADAAELREQPLRPTAGKARSAMAIPLAQVHPGENIRVDLPEIQELARSIREVGLLTALIVRPWNHDSNADGNMPDGADEGRDHYRLIAGHRRHAALVALEAAGVDGFDVVYCEVREGLTEAEAYALMLTENVQRVPLEPIQAARALRLLLDLNQGMSAAELSRVLGVRPAWSQLHLKLLDLPQEVQDRVEAGDLSITIADLLRRGQSMGRLDEGTVLDLAAKAARGEITSQELQNQAGPPRSPNTVGPKTMKLGPDGRPVKPATHWEPPREPVDWPTRADAAGKASTSPPPAPMPMPAPDSPRFQRDVMGEEPLDFRLDAYLLGRALHEWADDDYLDEIGIDRVQTDAYADALTPEERVTALRRLSFTLRQTEQALATAQ